MKVTVSAPLRVERVIVPHAGYFAPQLWRVLETVTVTIGSGAHWHIFTIDAGLITDFASVPKWLKPFLPDALIYGTAAACHDQLYKTGEVGKRIADSLLAGLLIDVDGAAEWQAEVMFLAVHLFGFSAWNGHRKEDAPC